MSHKVRVLSLFVVAVLVLSMVTLPLLTRFAKVEAATTERPPIKIGHIAPLTGVSSYVGLESVDSLRLWAKLVNEKGGILGRRVEIATNYDCKMTPAVGVDMLRKAVLEDKANFIIYCGTSGVTLAQLPVAQELKTVYFASQGSTDKYFSLVNRYTFRVIQPTVVMAYAQAVGIFQKYPKMKKVAYIFPDMEWGHDQQGFLKKFLTKFRPDIQIVAELWPSPIATEMRPYATQLATMDIDTMICGMPSLQEAGLIKELKDFGVIPRIEFIDSSPSSLDLSKTMGNQMVPTWGGGVYDPFQVGIPENEEFLREWAKMYPEKTVPNNQIATTYIIGQFLKAAIEKVGTTDALPVIRALEGLTLKTIAGNWKMREWDHQAIAEWMPYGKLAPRPGYSQWVFTETFRVPIWPVEDEVIPEKSRPGWRANSPQ